MGKSIFTMSAAQRLKAQQKQSKKFDHAVNKKFKAMKKAWKKKIAGKVFKGVTFVAVAAAAGAAIGKAREVIHTKSGDELREMASKIKVKFDEKKAEVTRKAGEAVKEGMARRGAAQDVKAAGADAEPSDASAAWADGMASDTGAACADGMPSGAAGAGQTPEKAAQEINQAVE